MHSTINALISLIMVFFASLTFAATGYIEGDYRIINAPQSGWIEQCDIVQGQRIAVGDLLFRFDSKDEQLAVERAKAQLAQAQANWQNLQSGEREQELQSLRSQRQEIESQLTLAQHTLKRYESMLNSRAISAIRVDEARTNVKVLTARIATIDDNLQAKGLAARHAVIAAADATVQSAKIAVQQAQSQLEQRQIHSRLQGKATQVYRFCGEFVSIGTPLLQILPNNARKVIFFIPQAERDTWKVGQTLHVTADSGATSSAEITHVAEYVEYTPPMIYSDSSRGDLVFRVEAHLDDDKPLPIGLPVEVSR